MPNIKTKIVAENLNEHVLNAMNLESLPEAQKAIMLDKMANVVNQRLLVRVFEFLESAEQKQLKNILDKGTEQEMQCFIEKNVPEFLNWVPEEVMRLKTEMIDNLHK